MFACESIIVFDALFIKNRLQFFHALLSFDVSILKVSRLSIRIESIKGLIQIFMQFSDVEDCIHVIGVKFMSFFVMFHSFALFLIVIEGTGKVKVALSACWIQLDSKLVRMSGLFVLLGHVVSVTKVVEGRIMLRVQTNRFQIEVNSINKLALVAERIAEIVIALHLFRVDLQGFLIIVNRIIDVTQKILSVGQVVVNICNFFIDLNHTLVVMDRLLCLLHIIQSVGDSNQSLNFFWVMV